LSYLPPPSTLPPGSIVDSYRRDSGGSKQDQSTGQQLNEIQEYCKKHNLVLRHNFCDEAKSGGSTAGRDDFNRFLDLYRIADQRPQGLILWNYARFARDFDNAVYYKSLIRTYKIIIHSLNDQVPEGDYGRIVEFFIDMSNEEKRRQTSADAKRGLRELVQKYGCVPGLPPVGFKREPLQIGTRRDGSVHLAHRWVPDLDLVPRIQQAFNLRAGGATLKNIMRETHLYNSINSFKTFFTNRLYIGILEFGDLVIEKYCDPIIDMDTWNAVQKRVAEYAQKRVNERHPRRTASPYLLSGIIFCGQCGSPMFGNTVNRQTLHRDEAYRCSRSRRTDQCNAGRISRSKLEAAVFDMLKEYVLIPENLQAIHDLVMQGHTEFESGRTDRSKVVSAEKKKISAQIANITKAIAERGALSPLLDKLTELTSRRNQISVEQKLLSAPIQPLPNYTPEQVIEISNGMITLLEESPPETVKLILAGLIKEIHAERKAKEIHGAVAYWYPFPFKLPPTEKEMLPISSSPVGAHLYKHSISFDDIIPGWKLDLTENPR